MQTIKSFKSSEEYSRSASKIPIIPPDASLIPIFTANPFPLFLSKLINFINSYFFLNLMQFL